MDHHNPDIFFYHVLTSFIGMNAVYVSAYVVFSIHILLHFWKPADRSGYLGLYLVLAFLVISCFTLDSKMMLLVLAVSLLYRLFHLKQRNRIQATLLAVGMVLLIVAAVMIIPQTHDRFAKELSSKMAVVQSDQYTYDTPFTGTSLRLVIWKFCFKLMREKNTWITGVGAGDYQDMLNQQYRSSGMYTGNPLLHETGYIGYGPHSEYIEIMLALGIPAFLFFCYLLAAHWKYALASNHYLLTELLILFTFFCMTESVLSTNKGIIFFLFFLSLLSKDKPSPAA
jgi:hypothetical protein